MIKVLIHIIICIACTATLKAQTIAEKKSGGGGINAGSELTQDTKQLLVQVNKEMRESQEELHKLYEQINDLYRKNAPEDDYRVLLEKVNREKDNIISLEDSWKDVATITGKEEQYALWNQPDTTIGQLVNDYGSQSYIYVSTPDIAEMRINVDSNLPIPRSSWNEILELVLTQNGIGFKQLNPYLRQLYQISQDKSNIKLITNKRKDLDLFPPDTKIAFDLTPEPSEVKRIWYFLDKFVNPNSTVIQLIGRDILIIGNIPEVQDLLKIYDFVAANKGDREFKAIPVTKVDIEEMAKILGSIFNTIVETPIPFENQSEHSPRGMPPTGTPTNKSSLTTVNTAQKSSPSGRSRSPSQQKENEEVNGLKIIALKAIGRALFLVGTKEEIRKAEEIVQQVEDQIGESRRKVIYWYVTKNSDPEELAQVLQKVYILMATTGTGNEAIEQAIKAGAQPPGVVAREQEIELQREQLQYKQTQAWEPSNLPRGITDSGFYLTDRFIVNPDPPSIPKQPPNQGRNNFLVDPKTSTIIMVVETDLLPKMKELIKKLDVPKKMVQIECMLFEKRITNDNNIGLNLLKIGSLASQTNATSVLFRPEAILRSITEFIISRAPEGNIPAYDATYRFLISRDDIFVKASPSILTVNQTKGSIEIDTQISVNTGTFVIQNAGVPTLQNAFARANYGIKIDVIPTIHMHSEDDPDGVDYITLESDLKFETIGVSTNHTPPVFRRIIKNTARIADGQTIILGGLREIDKDDVKESIPFLGEIPGFGKLFGTLTTHDVSVEMFIFMTPKIIAEPAVELERLRSEEMCRRPGDVPGFLCALVDAREKEKNQLMKETMVMLFGRKPDRCVNTEKCAEGSEYDGR